jgi:CspA family cold shock protein
MYTDGVVRHWLDDEGWGVLDSDRTPGGCWAHFSVVEMPGYRALVAGQQVSFTYEAGGQDGFEFSAAAVRPAGVTPGTPRPTPAPPAPSDSAAAYESTLTLRYDDGTVIILPGDRAPASDG